MDGTKEGRIEGREGGSRKNDWREGRRERGKEGRTGRRKGRKEGGSQGEGGRKKGRKKVWPVEHSSILSANNMNVQWPARIFH